jgi:diguanylate cyclase (GGDEF)-like protein/PAS domain S-box-containing protein
MAWPTSLFMLALATWLQPPTIMRRHTEKAGGFALGLMGAFASMFILFSASFGHVGQVGIGLATATLLVAGIRLALTVKERTDSLARRERHFKGLAENSSDTIAVINSDLTVRWMSATKQSALGWSNTKIVGKNLNDFDGMFAPIVDALKGLWPGQLTKIEWELPDSEGRHRFLESTITDLIEDADIRGYVINNRDITDRTILEGQLRHQAFHDPLTGLANRALFADRVDHALARLGRTGLRVAVLLIDLDGFKDVNDSLGHEAGDQMLCTVAETLHACIRPGDTVARLGGDEFAILMEDTDVATDATQLGERIRGALAGTALKTANRRVTASIGIATSEESDTRAKLLRDADTAMYWAKSRGKDSVKSFEVSMHQAANERYQLQSQVKEAIENEEFVLRYQPTFVLETGALEGFEALIRWQHPKLGLVSPDRFIPLAEESGLISPLGRWVLQEATRELARWSTTPGAGPITMAINVSARQMRDAHFVQDVRDAISNAGVDPARIVLEITETVLVDDPADVLRVLQELKTIGVRIAIDDFGTGYSSLSYLQNLPVDILKIDRSFVSPRGDTPDDNHSLLHAILNLAKSIGLLTVAEGVEESHQAAFLAAANCNSAQGFLWARPLTAEAARELVAEPAHVNRLAKQRIMAGNPES